MFERPDQFRNLTEARNWVRDVQAGRFVIAGQAGPGQYVREVSNVTARIPLDPLGVLFIDDAPFTIEEQTAQKFTGFLPELLNEVSTGLGLEWRVANAFSKTYTYANVVEGVGNAEADMMWAAHWLIQQRVGRGSASNAQGAVRYARGEYGVRFTTPWMYGGIAVLANARTVETPSAEERMMELFMPFHWTVWLVFFGMLCVTAALLLFADKAEKTGDLNAAPGMSPLDSVHAVSPMDSPLDEMSPTKSASDPLPLKPVTPSASSPGARKQISSPVALVASAAASSFGALKRGARFVRHQKEDRREFSFGALFDGFYVSFTS